MKRGAKADAVLNAKRRAALVDAVVQLIAQHGFHGASMRMISDRSGIGLGSMYLHFESRDQLIREDFKEVEGRLLEKAMREYSCAGTEFARAHLLFPGWRSSAMGDSHLFAISLYALLKDRDEVRRAGRGDDGNGVAR